MKILGIDPGTARAGWAIIAKENGITNLIAYGCITTSPTQSVEGRLLSLYKDIQKILVTYAPDIVVVEDLFFATNAKTAIVVAQARGVLLLAAADHHLSVVSYSPPAIKLAVAGYGKAEKIQVQKMVMHTLKLTELPQPDDAADAVAVALTHSFTERMKK